MSPGVPINVVLRSDSGRRLLGVSPAARNPGNAADVVGRHRGLVGRTLLVSGLTLLSRVLGFVREALSALLFGDASPVYDAFVTAWRVPNLFRRLLGEGALATALQTAITEQDADDGLAAGRRLFLATARWATGLLLVVCLAVILLTSIVPDAMPVTGWRWLGADPELIRDLTMRLIPFVVLVCLAALASGVLQVRGHFATPAWAPVATNVVWIGTLIAIGISFGWSAVEPGQHLSMAHALAWGVLAAGVVQLLVQLPALSRHGLLKPMPGEPEPEAAHAGAKARGVLWTSLPLALGAAVYQVNVMIDGLMAEALLAEGGPTTLYYANRIQQLPLALVAIAATSAVFPVLKALGHQRELPRLRALHDRTHFAILAIALPATAGLFVLAEPIAAVLLQRGAFGPEGVARTAAALRALAWSVVPAGALGLVTRTYFAIGDLKTPVRVSSVMLVANVGLNVVFVLGLGLDVEGLAWATVVTAWLNLAVLWPRIVRRLPPDPATPGRGLLGPIRPALCALASGACAHWTHASIADDPRSKLALCLAIAAGIGAFAVAARALKLPEWGSLVARVRGASTKLDRGPKGA